MAARDLNTNAIIAVCVALSFVVVSGVVLSGVAVATELPKTRAAATAGSLSAVPSQRVALPLPLLKNTDATDRLFTREIGDEHVFAVDSAPRDRGQGPAGSPVARQPDRAPAGATSATVATSHGSRAEPPHLAGTGASGDHEERIGMTAGAARDAVGEPVPADAWARIRASDRLPVSDHEAVRTYLEQYRREALWVDRILERGNVFITHLVDALDARFLPVELALLPAIESGFRPDVHSRGQAAGLWQIVPITAREIGLERNAWFDGRSDTIASTTAALDYLSYLSAEFHGDWELTLAAYNAGPGRVRRAIRRNAAAGKPTDFWSLPLPQETRDYVPKMLALVSLLKEESPVLMVPLAGASAGFEQVDVGTRISLDRAAELSGVPRNELERLNAGLLHGVTGPQGPHSIYFPEGASRTFLERLAVADRSQLFSLPATHEVVAGDTLSDIAHRYGMSQRRLMDLNALESAHLRVGQQIAVANTQDMPKTDIEYVVSIGDTLSAIAQRHSVERAAIRDADGRPLASDLIHPGETLMISVTIGNAG